MLSAVLLFALLVFAFSVVSRRLGRWSITAPIVFVGLGSVGGLVLDISGRDYLDWIKPVAEVTLSILLFHDAAQARPREFGSESGAISRLLLIGLPLTMLAGYFAGALLFPELGWAFLLLLAASLAPTDAGLGAATVLNPVVPLRVRRLLNVESGLNDGLATPVVLFAIAALAGEEGLAPRSSIREAVVEIAIGVVAGSMIGGGGGWILRRSRIAGWSDPMSRRLAVLGLPLIAYLGALQAHGNGFIAAFVAGSAFAGVARWTRYDHDPLEFTEVVAEPMGFLVWLVFGLVAVPFAVDYMGVREVVYAVASLTVIRMVPVALCLLGTGSNWREVSFIGWFGPRGLASVIFALLAREGLRVDDELATVIGVISLTVVLSVLAHGLTADRLAERFGRWASSSPPAGGQPAVAEGVPAPHATAAGPEPGVMAAAEAEAGPRPRGWRAVAPAEDTAEI